MYINIINRLIIALALIFSFHMQCFSQAADHKFWTSIDLKKEVKNWDLSAEVEVREKGFFEKTERLSLQIEGLYNFSKFLSSGISYSLMDFYDYKYDDYQLRHRVQAILGSDIDLGRFEFSIKERGELTSKDEKDRISDGEIDTYKINPEIIWRNKMKIEFDIPNFSLFPSLSLETFYLLNDPDGNRFEKLRYTFGLSYKVNKHNKFNVFGIYNNELIDGEADSYVTGLGYSYTF